MLETFGTPPTARLDIEKERLSLPGSPTIPLSVPFGRLSDHLAVNRIAAVAVHLPVEPGQSLLDSARGDRLGDDADSAIMMEDHG